MSSSHSPIVASVMATQGRPFNLAGLVSATGLNTRQVYATLHRLVVAGLVRIVGERRQSGRSGRGLRVYALAAPDELELPPGTLLARIAQLLPQLAQQYEFTTADMVELLGTSPSGWPQYDPTTVKLALELLERRDLVAQVLEQPIERTQKGRLPTRWTSNPQNLAMQRSLRSPISPKR